MESLVIIKPRSNCELSGVVCKTLAALNGTLQPDWKISTVVADHVIAFVPLLQSDDSAMEKALSAQTAKSWDVHLHLKIMHWFVVDMINELNRNIRRGVSPVNNGFKPHDRSYCGLAVDSGKLPRLVTSTEIVNFTKKCIDGEQARIDDNKPALVATTKLMLEHWYNLYLQKLAEYIPLKAAYQVAEKQMAARREEGLKLYDDIEADLKSKLRSEKKEAFRRISADWGLIFKGVGYDPDVYAHVTSLIKCDDSPVQNVTIEFVDLNLKFKTDHYGEISTFKVKGGLHNVKIYCEGYTSVDIPEFKVELNTNNIVKATLEMVIIESEE